MKKSATEKESNKRMMSVRIQTSLFLTSYFIAYYGKNVKKKSTD